jgi:hypothetical protein
MFSYYKFSNLSMSLQELSCRMCAVRRLAKILTQLCASASSPAATFPLPETNSNNFLKIFQVCYAKFDYKFYDDWHF